MRSMVCNKNIMRVVILNVNIFSYLLPFFIFTPGAGEDAETRPPVAAIRDPQPARPVRVSR